MAKGADTSTLYYRFFIRNFGHNRQVFVRGGDVHRGECHFCQKPTVVGFRTGERSIELYVSKVLFGDARSFEYSADATWFGKAGRYARLGVDVDDYMRFVDLKRTTPATLDLSHAAGATRGNAFEVFHYPYVTKKRYEILQDIYRKHPPREDMAIIMTDFRIDSLYAHGSGAPATNFPVKGIGRGADRPQSTAAFGWRKLQISMVPFWVGAEMFAETGKHKGRRFFNYARAVGWVGHEAVHRWGMGLSFKHPKTGKNVALFDDRGHWVEGLHTASLAHVAHRYQNDPPAERSLMEGSAWIENADGTWSKSGHISLMPAGFCPLDLYAMGMLEPGQVPDTFLLENLKKVGANKYRAEKTPVRIADVIAAMGPRVPSAAASQKHFTMAAYVVHPKGRPVDAAKLKRARGLVSRVVDFFPRATAGRMTISPSR